MVVSSPPSGWFDHQHRVILRIAQAPNRPHRKDSRQFASAALVCIESRRTLLGGHTG